jgi:hypothetical protein
MDTSNDRMRILEMIEEGRITADEGLQLLQALNNNPPVDLEQASLAAPADYTLEPEQEIPLPSPTIELPEPEPVSRTEAGPQGAEAMSSPAPQPAPTSDPDISKWKRWWMVPLWLGVAVTIFGGLFMFWAQQSSGLGFWFACAAVPFALGLVVIVLAWQSRNAPWLHLRVQQRPGEKPERIAFSFPLPVRPAVWFFHTFGKHIHGLEDQNLDQIIQAFGENANPENPIYIQVDEEESGEKVEIYIG